jgi:hypothetical protein
MKTAEELTARVLDIFQAAQTAPRLLEYGNKCCVGWMSLVQ